MRRKGDVVLIYYQDQPALFARIESIDSDIKKEWYQVTLLLLTIPTQTVTWILREEYIDGTPFTMGGKPMKLEEVKQTPDFDFKEKKQTSDIQQKEVTDKSGTVIPFKKP